jgi:hypothetical protein
MQMGGTVRNLWAVDGMNPKQRMTKNEELLEWSGNGHRDMYQTKKILSGKEERGNPEMQEAE